MSTPPNGLRDKEGFFGERAPEVSVELERRDPLAESTSLSSGDDLNARGGSLGDPNSALEPDPRIPEAAELAPGVTQPSRRGSSSRFLTDVIVEMGLAPRERVDLAIEASRNEGTTPERVLLAGGVITHDGLSRAHAERYGICYIYLSTVTGE